MIKVFSDNAWSDYTYWQVQDRKTLKKINQLIRDIERDNFKGLGKPEPLKHDYQGLWSRRINDVDRLIYYIEKENLFIVACKGHYN